jgi:tripartite-type tricarboxylate transporter receptor subunit TctC
MIEGDEMNTKRRFAKVMLAMVMGFSLSSAIAQEVYPSKPIRLIVPFPPGGSTDIFARMLGDKLSQSWKQPIIVENKPGASGQIAVDALLKAPADGYTIFMGHIGTLAVNPSLFETLNYNPQKDLMPVSRIATVPNILVVNPSLPFKSIAELVSYAKKNPGKLNYSSGGNGGAAHIAMEYFKMAAGVDIMHIPYKGTVPSVTDLLGGQVNMTMTGAPPLMQHIQVNKLRALGVSSTKRIDALPSLPAIAESGVTGLNGFDATQWYGLVVKTGTSRDIITKLNAGVKETFENSAARERLKGEGAIVQTDTPEEFAKFIQSETVRWARVIKTANVKPN